MAVLIKNQQEIGSNLLMKVSMALLIKMKVFMAVLIKNQQEIGSNLLMKLFMAVLIKNQQEIRPKDFIRYFCLLIKNQHK